MRINKLGIVMGLMLLTIGTVIIVVNPSVIITLPLTFMSVGGYVFGISLASLILRNKYYSDTSAEAFARNQMLKKIELLAFTIVGVIMGITLIMCIIVLK